MSDDKRDEPQDLRKELNQLWRTTLDQFDGLKDAIVRSSTAGKAKLDATFLRRQRDKRVLELGERVLELERKGELKLPERFKETLAAIDELEAQIEEQESEVDRLMHRDQDGGSERGEGDESTPEEADKR